MHCTIYCTHAVLYTVLCTVLHTVLYTVLMLYYTLYYALYSYCTINQVDDFLDDCAVFLVEVLGHDLPFLLSIVPLAANNLVLLRAFLVCASLSVLMIALYESQVRNCSARVTRAFY
jgi:hypothetical protein